MKSKKIAIGIICGILTGLGWGISGIFSQYLFTNTTMEPGWFVSVRMIVSGILLLIYQLFTNKEDLLRLWQNKPHLLTCMTAGVLGNMMFQLSCYSAVKESNAPTAIVLQYLCPVIIILFLCMQQKRIPHKIEIISIVFALSGVFIIATHGNINELIITPKALLYGIGTALFMALGSLIPEKLYAKYSVQSITGIMITTGGIVSCMIIRPWNAIPKMNLPQLGALSGAIVFGGVLAYIFFAVAIKTIGSAKASLCACTEIPASTILAVLFLENTFSVIDLIGFALIGSTIFLSTINKNK